MKRSQLPKRLPKPQSTHSPEREYLRNVMLYQKTYMAILRTEMHRVLPGLIAKSKEELPEEFKTDSATRVPHFDVNIEKGIRELFASVQDRLRKKLPVALLRKWAQAMVGHVNTVASRNATQTAKVADIDFEPLMVNKKLTPYFKNVVDENVGLIVSISDKNIPRFKNLLVYSITNDIHNKDFWHKIEQYVDQNTMSTRAHAKLIARDQVNKLNGKISQYRQQQIGVSRYIWRTSDDERVRKSHKDLDGTVQRWDQPPVTDRHTGRRCHPGQDFQCRCTAEAVLEDVLD